MPSSPYEAKGLLIQSIRDDDPVIFCEHKALYDTSGDVPEDSYTIPFGEANVVRDGGDVTIVAIGRMVAMAEEAAKELADNGIEAEIIDPRTTSPLDTDTILESVGKHRTAGRRRRGLAALQPRHGHLRARRQGGVRLAAGADRDGDAAAHAGAVLRRARGPLHPGRAEGAQRGEGGCGVPAMIQHGDEQGISAGPLPSTVDA